MKPKPTPKQGRLRFEDELRDAKILLLLTETTRDKATAAAKREGVSRNQWLNLAVTERLLRQDVGR